MGDGRWQLASKVATALVPLLLAALVTIGWQNSHTLALQAREIAAMDVELKHLRELVEHEMKTP